MDRTPVRLEIKSSGRGRASPKAEALGKDHRMQTTVTILRVLEGLVMFKISFCLIKVILLHKCHFSKEERMCGKDRYTELLRDQLGFYLITPGNK